MCHRDPNASSRNNASITRRARKAIVAVTVALVILGIAGCATTMTQKQEEAAWRTMARNVGMLAYAFSPEARAAHEICCAVRSQTNEETLRQLWSELDAYQAQAIVQMINDTVTLAEAYFGDEAKDREAFFGSILEAICMGASMARPN